MLFFTCKQDFNWNQLKNGDYEMTELTQNILLLIPIDALAGIPGEDTQALRESTISKGKICIVFQRIQNAFPEDAGTLYQRNL